MRFRISDFKKFINLNSKPKRNVVYKIGYDKFSIRKFFENSKRYILSQENKMRFRNAFGTIKNLFKRV